MSRKTPRIVSIVFALAAVAGLLGACGSDGDDGAATGPSGSDDGVTPTDSDTPEAADCVPETLPEPITAAEVDAADTDGVTVRLLTHDSFALSDGIFDDFTAETGIDVEVITSDDAGSLVSQAVLTAGNPVGDVLFGIDNTFLCRGTANDVFVPYRAANLDDVPDELQLAEADLLTPIDFGDVCLNYSRTAHPDGEGAPESLGDLLEPEFRDAFVTQNPETSSPGMAFLLATIAEFGEDGWEEFWRDLRANGVEVTSGWTEAYEERFGAGSGKRTIVNSYASSPVADVLYSDPPRDEPNIGIVTDACFRQVEFAGILRGTDRPEAAAKLIDFLLSPTVQSDIPLNMFVNPANATAEIPEEYAAHSIEVTDPLTLDPAEIEAGRDRWTEAWTEIVLR